MEFLGGDFDLAEDGGYVAGDEGEVFWTVGIGGGGERGFVGEGVESEEIGGEDGGKHEEVERGGADGGSTEAGGAVTDFEGDGAH